MGRQTLRPKGSKSCCGCGYLYTKGMGYSNYTWEETFTHCALDKNKNLPEAEPSDWKNRGRSDNWPVTWDSRCASYYRQDFKMVALDVDHENGPAHFTLDRVVINTVCKHSGRKPLGGYISGKVPMGHELLLFFAKYVPVFDPITRAPMTNSSNEYIWEVYTNEKKSE